MTVTEAAKVWVETKREMQRLEPQLKAAGEILKAHAEKTKKSDYRGLIGFGRKGRTILDKDKIAAHFGDRLPEVQRKITWIELSLLK